jgi:hypothetical protein
MEDIRDDGKKYQGIVSGAVFRDYFAPSPRMIDSSSLSFGRLCPPAAGADITIGS